MSVHLARCKTVWSRTSTLEAANAFLPGFLANYNTRFDKLPQSNQDAHRPAEDLAPLTDVFAWKERAYAKQQSDGAVRQGPVHAGTEEITRPLARQRVTVVDYPDGRVAIRHQGRDLPYRTFDKLQKVNQAAIVENKRLGEVLAYIAEQQQLRDEGRSQKAPRRRGQADRHIFKAT